jgi:NAD(P)-dependent dehydrogenase (short-subunit alcohol dehydrogenase family)
LYRKADGARSISLRRTRTSDLGKSRESIYPWPTGRNGPLLLVSQFDGLFDVHVKGVYFLTQALLPLIADGGRIVNFSSGLTRFSAEGFSAYAAAKGAIEVLTRYLAKELGPRGIAVNTVAPGAIETDFGGGIVRDNAEVNALYAGMTALGRVGVPDDIGPMVASLLSDDNRWVTAQRIEVSGGQAI